MPDEFEETVAELCAEHFQSDIEFIVRNRHTTPDIKVVKTRQSWEIKNIRGYSKHTIEDNLRKANKQADNIIVSLLRSSRMDATRAEARIRYMLKATNVKFRHVLLITKDRKIIDII